MTSDIDFFGMYLITLPYLFVALILFATPDSAYERAYYWFWGLPGARRIREKLTADPPLFGARRIRRRQSPTDRSTPVFVLFPKWTNCPKPLRFLLHILWAFAILVPYAIYDLMKDIRVQLRKIGILFDHFGGLSEDDVEKGFKYLGAGKKLSDARGSVVFGDRRFYARPRCSERALRACLEWLLCVQHRSFRW